MYIRIWLPLQHTDRRTRTRTRTRTDTRTDTRRHTHGHAHAQTRTRTYARGSDTDSACFCVQLLQMLHGQMEDIDTRLAEAEKIKVAWTPVQDMIIESLPDQLDELKVSSFS